MRFDTVRRVAVRAHCGHRETAFHQPLPVNALGIMLKDLVLLPDVSHRRLLARAVAPAAQRWHVGRENRGLRVQLSERAVGPVALLAGRGVVVVFRHKHPVQAFLVQLAYFRMARRAVDLTRDRLAGPSVRDIHLRVTLAAADAVVARSHEHGAIDRERAAVARRPDLWVLMTAEAVRIRHALIVEHLPDFVRLVAIDAGGQRVGFFLPELAFDDFPVDKLDLCVAFGAGGGDLFPGD